MILYFTGSGNSRAVAEKLGRKLGETVVSITDQPPEKLVFEGETFGFVFPIYSWGTPLIVTDYIRNLNPKAVEVIKKKDCWMICTCGDDTGMAPEMYKKSLADRGLELSAGWSLTMPNTYVVLPGFDVDSKELEIEKLQKTEKRLSEIGSKILNREWEESYCRGSLPRLKSLIFPLFNRWGINTEKWHFTADCIQCGVCSDVCPKGNIKIMSVGDKTGPVWGKDCISCLACYNCCPKHAVQYGSITKSKGQYHFTNWP